MTEFEKTIKSFFDEIFALETSMPLSAYVFSTLYLENNNIYKKYIKEKCILIEEIDDNNFRYEVPEHEIIRYRKFTPKINDLETAKNILPRMFIVTLICQYDAYIGCLMRLVLLAQPNILNSSERKLSFEEITKFKTMDEAKIFIIEKEIESTLRKSHNDHITWFENKLNLNLRSDKKLLCKFFEITERRNIFTHNNAIVSDTYIKNCKSYSCDIGDVNEGDALSVDQKYLEHSVNTIIELAIKIGCVIWRKLDKENIKDTEVALNNIVYDLIKKEKYALAVTLVDFSLSDFIKFSSSANKLMLIINKAQALKWAGKEEQALKLISEQDWSICSDDFLVAKYVIENNYTDALALINKSSCIDKESLIEWPLFSKLREFDEFSSFFSSKYGKTVEEIIADLSPDVLQKQFKLTIEEERPIG
jgi:hypothetical protein